MAFRLYVSNTVTVPVAGKLPGADGKPSAFSFSLQAKRLGQSALKDLLDANTRTVPEVLQDVIAGWDGVLDDDGNQVPFTPANLTSLLEIVGMAGVIFAAYLDACGAKGAAKN